MPRTRTRAGIFTSWPAESRYSIVAGRNGCSRFVVSRSPRRLGFYRNFERALRLAPPGAPLIALCDQDDASVEPVGAHAGR